MFDSNATMQQGYKIEQQRILFEAKEAAHNFFDAMSKLDTEHLTILIHELQEKGMMKNSVIENKN